MGGQNLVQRRRARLAGRGELGAHIVHQFICFVVDLLFRDGQHLAEVTLDGGFHGAVALNMQHVPRAHEHKGRSGQDDRELQRQEQPGLLVPPFRCHC